MDYVTELRRIDAEINRYQPPQHARDIGSVHSRRRLSVPEWRIVKRAIASGLPAMLSNGNFGFGIVLSVWEPGARVYPGTEEETSPACLVYVHADQVPGKMRTRISDEFGVFDLFMALVNTPENIALLERDGLALPRARGYYSY